MIKTYPTVLVILDDARSGCVCVVKTFIGSKKQTVINKSGLQNDWMVHHFKYSPAVHPSSSSYHQLLPNVKHTKCEMDEMMS